MKVALIGYQRKRDERIKKFKWVPPTFYFFGEVRRKAD